WPLIKRLLTTPAETRWVGFARDGIVEMGDQAADCAAFARLAYKVGDLDSYNYGCYLLARELVHLFLKQRGPDYFRKHQPYHSMEFIGDPVFLTCLQADRAGWQIDGPQYPANARERQFHHRWRRFEDIDVARFIREVLMEDTHRELDWLARQW